MTVTPHSTLQPEALTFRLDRRVINRDQGVAFITNFGIAFYLVTDKDCFPATGKVALLSSCCGEGLDYALIDMATGYRTLCKSCRICAPYNFYKFMFQNTSTLDAEDLAWLRDDLSFQARTNLDPVLAALAVEAAMDHLDFLASQGLGGWETSPEQPFVVTA